MKESRDAEMVQRRALEDGVAHAPRSGEGLSWYTADSDDDDDAASDATVTPRTEGGL